MHAPVYRSWPSVRSRDRRQWHARRSLNRISGIRPKDGAGSFPPPVRQGAKAQKVPPPELFGIVKTSRNWTALVRSAPASVGCLPGTSSVSEFVLLNQIHAGIVQ